MSMMSTQILSGTTKSCRPSNLQNEQYDAHFIQLLTEGTGQVYRRIEARRSNFPADELPTRQKANMRKLSADDCSQKKLAIYL